MINNKQLINVTFKDSNKKYVFIAEESLIEKDIVLCNTQHGVAVGIVVDTNLDLSILNNGDVTLPVRTANYLCKSTHVLSTSRNNAIKAIIHTFDTSFFELEKSYERNKNQKFVIGEDLPFWEVKKMSNSTQKKIEYIMEKLRTRKINAENDRQHIKDSYTEGLIDGELECIDYVLEQLEDVYING